jgi:polysaccharide export outer membrane protein
MKFLAAMLLLGSCCFAQSSAELRTEVDYHIGIDDIVTVSVFRSPEFGGTAKVTPSGMISLPNGVNVKAAGLTTKAVGLSVEAALGKFLVDPRVVVEVKETAAIPLEPVSVIGAVRKPDVYQIKRSKPLMELILNAGGLADNAGKEIQVIRPRGSSVERETILISAEDLFQNANLDLNIAVLPGDTVNVPLTPPITVLGEVARQGELPLKFGRGMTVRQAISFAGGFTKDAKRKECKIIRTRVNEPPEEIALNLEKVLDASFVDQPLLPNDILVIPAKKPKAGFMKALSVAEGIATTRLIYLGT